MVNDEINKNIEVIDDAYFCKTVKAELQNLTEEYKKKIKKNFLFEYLFKIEVLVVSFFLAPLLSGILLLKDSDIISTHYVTSLFVLLSLLLVLFTFLYYEIEEAQNNECLNKIDEAEKILSPRNFIKNKKDDIHFNYLCNSNFIFILRNKKWELLPTNLLIKQDVFLLRAGDLIPCRCVEYNINNNEYGREYEKHEVFMPMDKYKISVNLLTKYCKDEKREYLPSFHLYSFVSYDNVSISTIKRYIEDKTSKNKNSKNKAKLRNVILTERIHRFYIYTWTILFFISSLSTVISLLDLRKDIGKIPHFVVIYFLIYNVLMSITALPFFHRIFSELIYGYCSSLNMIYKDYFKNATNYEQREFSSSFDFSSTTEDSSYVNKKKIGLFYTLKSIFMLIIKGIKIDKCYLNILSDCSVLCFVDSSSILFDSNHSIKEICIYNYLNNKKDVCLNSSMNAIPKNYNYILTIIDVFMDNKSMYAYQRIKNLKILHSLFLISYYTQIPKYIKLLDAFQNHILNYMNQGDCSFLYICLCDIGHMSNSYNKFLFHMLFFCIENKSDYELYKKKNTELKKHKKSVVPRGELPYYVYENEEKENSLGINIYDNLMKRDNFVFIFILYEKRKDKYHMFLKQGQLDALLSKCMFYYDGKIIKKLKRTKKKVLRILNIQWISSGIESICFAYRPLSKIEVEYLKQNFSKNIYILTINKRKVYNIKNFYNEKSFPVKENQKFLSHLLSTSIFIGNSAVKLLTSNEIQTRINDFYDSGIRFVHFSKTDQANTRNVANLLGMETNWNTSISLSLNDKLGHIQPSFKNRDGKVVIPSGINNIKTHIEEVDDIPLRVSSYSGCNQFNTAEMIKILLENNEIITCVGNSLNCENFGIFNLCNYSISVLLPFNNVCKDCYGKRGRSSPFEEPSAQQNPLITYSSFVNSFPYMSQNIMEIVVDFLLFILLIIPLLAMSLLSNNNNSTIMNDIPDKVITKEFLVNKLFFFLIKWIPLLVFSTILSLYYLHLINKAFANKYVISGHMDAQMSSSLKENSMKNITHHCSQVLLIKSFYKCQVLLHTYSTNQPSGKLSLNPCSNGVYPDITLIVLMLIFNGVILVTNETIKKVEEKIQINRQKYLKVLFGTRLGMWSPK
ncbi:uncharacterized protein MKS88_000025 [Plasmodium brasilianum]|uniref:uncharacterized protein n=1 Tax=Plasmodium brasilianum TaxID=5824 RepID=UPI00350E5287|nr:hypothetical protein MKS88_000025 [Plasmodium brasilianum]